MDPWALLGLGRAASAAEVRRAHRALAERLAQAGAPDGVLQMLHQARDLALLGPGAGGAPVPPAGQLLGVPRGASPDQVRTAWRRVAAVVHPDRGGTDELFRAVSAAHDELLGRGAAPRGRAGDPMRRYRPRARPPQKPPPPGPFRAPPAAERIRPSRRQATFDLLIHGGVLVAAITAAAFGAIVGPWWTPLAVLAVAVAAARPLRSELHAAARASIRLQVLRRAVRPDEAPDRFLAECALDVPVGREWDDLVYERYQRWCSRRGVAGLPAWAFVEELRSYGLLYVRSSSWDRAVWVGLRLRDRDASS